MRDHSDALCQLEPSDAHDAMSRGSFPLDPRHFASVWDDRPPGGLGHYYKETAADAYIHTRAVEGGRTMRTARDLGVVAITERPRWIAGR